MAFDDFLSSGLGHGNYTGILTRTIVYSSTLLIFLAATAMTIASIAIPKWISLDDDQMDGATISYGLHRRCNSVTKTCTKFPQYEDCREDRYFCSMWRSVGFLMSFAVVIEGMCLIAYIVILGGGKQKREQGWSILSFLIVIAATIQCASMSLVAYLFDNDARFFPGFQLDSSWILCTVSWSLMLVCAAAVTIAAFVLPSEGGYELIPNFPNYGYSA